MNVKLLIVCLSLMMTNPNLLFAMGIENLLQYTAPEESMVNVNDAQIIEDQAGGFLSGGSIINRGPRPIELKPFQIQLPSAKYDPCTGSGDFRFGSMSYISGEEFVRVLKGIPRAAGAYGTMLFLKTVCPQCSDVINNLHAKIERINALTINQCSIAQTMVDGIGGKLLAGSKLACQVRSNAGTRNPDLWATTKACQEKPNNYKDAGNEEVKNLINEEFNLVWRALKQDSSTTSDQGFLELVMSITGTVTGEVKDSRPNLKILPSLLASEKEVQNYIGNKEEGNIKVYFCDEPTKCLNPKIVNKKIKFDDTFYGKLHKILANIREKILTDGAVSSEEQSIITYSSLPIINMIEQDLVLKGKSASGILINSEMLDIVAVDVVVGFLQAQLEQATTQIKRLEFAQLDNSIFVDFKASLNKVRSKFQEHKMSSFQRATVTLQAKEYLKQQDIALKDRFSRMIGARND